jgi:hypothetical protein
MRSIFIATLSIALLTAATAAEKKPSPSHALAIDHGALVCPYWVLTEISGLQKRCHPEDREFGKRLDESIRKMDQFFLTNKWADDKTIGLAHRNFELHPPLSTTEHVSDVCKYSEIQQLYQNVRKSMTNMRHEVDNLLANPPLMKTPYGTPCL